MAIETERKFLVKGDYKHLAIKTYRIRQAYLCADCQCSIRVRIRDTKGFLTIKGKSSDLGLSRYEWEKEIPLTEAEELMSLCKEGTIDKYRHLVPVGKHVFEVDEFLGENEGLIMAEIELANANEVYERPEWLGEEVTGDSRYYNAYLSQHPYSSWR